MKHRILSRPSYSLLELELEKNEEVLAESGAMVYMRNVEISPEIKGGILGGLKRSVLGGESFLVNRYISKDKGLLGLAPRYNGDIAYVKISGRLYAQSGAFLASSPSLNIDIKWGGAKSFFAGEGLFLLKIEGSGDLFLSSFGGIEEINVDGMLSVDTGHIVAFEDTLDFKIRKSGGLKATILSGEGLIAEFNGKGKVWIQTRSISEYIGWLSSLLPSQRR